MGFDTVGRQILKRALHQPFRRELPEFQFAIESTLNRHLSSPLARGCLSSEFRPVVKFLNGEGGPQQILKGLLVQYQVGPLVGNDIVRRIVPMDAIVVQVWEV